MNAFDEAKGAWEAMEPIREKRERLKRFTYGQQWSDLVDDPETGLPVTEAELMARRGHHPLTNNLIRQMVKNIVGRFRSEALYRNSQEASEGDSASSMYARLADLYLSLQLDELDSRLLEEFLISGIAIQRVGSDAYSRAKKLPLVQNVSPVDVFFTPPADQLSREFRLIGMVRSYTPEEIVTRWGGTRRSRAMSMLANLRKGVANLFNPSIPLKKPILSSVAADSPLINVIEVWRKEWYEAIVVHDSEHATVDCLMHIDEAALRKENKLRRRGRMRPLFWQWILAERWTARWFLADGTLLDTVTVADGCCHPFHVKLYPCIDGEIHSLVEDVVDQQKYVNRLINIMDRMMGTVAKGALLFPVEALPEGVEMDDITRQWSATDGVVLYRGQPNRPEPRQLNSTVGDIGARDLLKTEMQLFKEISGVTDVLAGHTISGTAGAERYNLEVRNAAIAIRDLLDTFRSVITRRNASLLTEPPTPVTAKNISAVQSLVLCATLADARE